MTYSYRLIISLNIALSIITSVIYWFYINLWLDQAIILSSALGSVLSSITLLIMSFNLFKKTGGKGFLGYTILFVITVCFLIQTICFTYCFWLKPI